MRRAAIILDRDGTLIADGAERKHERPEDIPLLPGVRAACELLRSTGYALFMATNQACIGRGESTFERQEDVCYDLAHRLGLTAWRICSHSADKGCSCRKPSPGMLVSLIDEYSIDVSRSWFIGNAQSDVEAGLSAGMRAALLSREPVDTTADYVFSSLAEFALLLARSGVYNQPGGRGF